MVLLTTTILSTVKNNFFIINLFFAVLQSTNAKPQGVNFPQLTTNEFVEAEPCSNAKLFCGGDENKYPSLKRLNEIINSELSRQEFDPIRDLFVDTPNETVLNATFRAQTDTGDNNDEFISVCSSRQERITTYARSMNRLGKWKYIVQSSSTQLQKTNIIVCENEGSKCKNDLDAPYGPDSTRCRQLYRYEKLLAIDETGELSVDTFPLPSACVCNYAESGDATSLRIGVTGQSFHREGLLNHNLIDGCSHNESILTLEEFKNIRSKRAASDKIYFPGETFEALTHINNNSVIKNPCDSATLFCDNDPEYPMVEINNVLRTSNDSNLNLSGEIFTQFFSDPCPLNNEELDDITLKKGIFELNEEQLCTSDTRYSYPQRGVNIRGDWKFIVNTDTYQQGITLDTCISGVEGTSCKYGGLDGNNPNGTMCIQQYSLHDMIVVDPQTKKLSVDTFKIPTACLCHITPDYPLEF